MRKRGPVPAGVAMCIILFTAAIFQMSGCGGGSGGGSAAVGTLQVAITDAPASAFASVHVTVDKVVVVPAGKEGLADNDASLPVVASFPGGTGVDILSLHFLPQILGNVALPAGKYTQVRLILAANQSGLSNYVTLTSNPAQKLPLTTPSAQQTGLKIVGDFTVSAGTLNTILLDFDPSRAIVFAGNSGQIILKPTGIRISQIFNSLTNAGAVTGAIRSPLFTAWSSATVTVVPRNPAGNAVSSGIVFSNFSSPSVWKSSFTAFLPPNGSATVPAANYKVFVQAFRDTGSKNPVFNSYSSPLFTVTSGVDTLVPPSGTVLLVP